MQQPPIPPPSGDQWQLPPIQRPPIQPNGRAWLAPGVVIAVVTLVISFAGGYGGSKYREGEAAASQAEHERRITANTEAIKQCVSKEIYLNDLKYSAEAAKRLEEQLKEIRAMRQR